MYTSGFQVVAVTLAGGVLIEGLCWLLVYRTSNYQRLSKEVERQTAKLEALKSGTDSERAKKAKVQRVEALIKAANEGLAGSKWWTSAITAVVLLVMYNLIATAFDGKVVAKLPFEAPSMMRGLSHRHVAGDDYTDCGSLLIYVLTMVGLRPTMQALISAGPPRAQQQANPAEAWLNRLKQQ